MTGFLCGVLIFAFFAKQNNLVKTNSHCMCVLKKAATMLLSSHIHIRLSTHADAYRLDIDIKYLHRNAML